MDPVTFAESFRATTPEISLKALCRRFNHAFRSTRDLDSAMAAVNEMLDRPLSYREFYSLLHG